MRLRQSCEGRSVKANSRTTDMHVLEKSDCLVVPVNQPNKGRQLPAEAGEGRGQLEENIDRAHMLLTSAGVSMSQPSTMCVMQFLTPFILQKSRMRKRARTDLRRGRSVMIVPTATVDGAHIERKLVDSAYFTDMSASAATVGGSS